MCCWLAVLCLTAAAADEELVEALRWESAVSITLEGSSRPPVEFQTVSWLSTKTLKIESLGDVLLADLATGAMTMTKAGQAPAAVDVSNWRRTILAEGGQGFLSAAASELAPQATGQSAVIAGYRCQEYSLVMFGATSRIWVTTDASWSAFAAPMLEQLWRLMGPAALLATESTPAIPGFALQFITTAPGWRHRQTVETIRIEHVPARFFH